VREMFMKAVCPPNLPMATITLSTHSAQWKVRRK
jgi:hypothetical protein